MKDTLPSNTDYSKQTNFTWFLPTLALVTLALGYYGFMAQSVDAGF
jgi:hypothetical protein